MEEDEYFILSCFLVAKRSHDAQTQCGCVIVKDGIELSCGFNGFLRNSKDNELPNVRPEKYKYIIHSEANAIYNAARKGVSLLGSTAYITGQCCPECFKSMVQSGIKEIVYTDYNDHSTAKEEKGFLQELIDSHEIKVRIVEIDKAKIDLIRSL
jgi:dCMP deaminase